MASLYDYLKKRKQVLEVDMDDDGIVFANTGRRGIGTPGLNGCTCVVVLGEAIILSHISPLPGTYQQSAASSLSLTRASHDHLKKALLRITRLLLDNVDRFPKSSTSWGIFATSSEGYLESVEHQVEQHLASLGYPMRASFYKELDPQSVEPPKGEVITLFNEPAIAELYLKSTKLEPSPPQGKQVEAARATSSGGPSWRTVTPAVARTSGSSSQPATAASSGGTNVATQWRGYTLVRSVAGFSLHCTIGGRQVSIEARWTEGQPYPLIKDPVMDCWSQTVPH